MYLTFAQPKLKPTYEDRVRRLFNLVKTKASPDLWIKVLIKGANKERYMNYGWGCHWERDQEQIQFYFSNRFVFENISKQSEFVIGNNGHYRWTRAHGFYDKEWAFIKKHPKIAHVITLKISHNSDDKDIAWLIAHEFRHYLQYKKYGYKMISLEGYKGRRTRPIQVERDANKWAKARIDTLRESGLL